MLSRKRKSVKSGIRFLELSRPHNIKDVARVVQAYQRWNRATDELVSNLVFNPVREVRDTARACSALSHVGHARAIALSDCLVRVQLPDGSWNQDVYDTAYSLIALADNGISNPRGCHWLAKSLDKNLAGGTTALAVTALTRQEQHPDLVEIKIPLLADYLSSCPFPGTGNIVMQALILNGLRPEVDWLLDLQNADGSWGSGSRIISTTALSLITLSMISP